MSMLIIVGPPEPSDWHLEPEEFAQALLTRWPQAEIRTIADPDSSAAVEFEIPGTSGAVTGSFGRTGRAMILDYGAMEDIATLVVWFRSLVQPAQPLIVGSGPGYFCELTPEMSPSDFLKRFQ